MEFVKKNIAKWASALILLVIGILCIVAGAAAGGETTANAYEGISITLGVVFIIIAVIALILGIVAVVLTKNATSLANTGIGAGITLAAGIFFCVNKYTAAQLIWLFIDFVPYVLVVVGAVIACDAIFLLVFSIVKKSIKTAIPAICIEAIVAIVSMEINIFSLACFEGLDNNEYKSFFTSNKWIEFTSSFKTILSFIFYIIINILKNKNIFSIF